MILQTHLVCSDCPHLFSLTHPDCIQITFRVFKQHADICEELLERLQLHTKSQR